jgi:hypothetical protein
MSDIKFACPHCNQHITCDAGYGDLSINCPACGNSMVVPRLLATAASHPATLLVASTHTSRPLPLMPPPQLTAWTEEEWVKHSQALQGNTVGEAPYFILSFFVTLILAFVLKTNQVGTSAILASVIVGGLATVVLALKHAYSSGPSLVLKTLGIAAMICVGLPSIALGILLIGCGACR